MNNINITTLDDLIKEKREKKKKAPTAQDSKQFRDAWTGLITNEGFTKRVERYLYEGFFFCGAEPFESYLCQAKEPDEVLTSFFAGDMYGADMSATFRLLTHLLALLLNDGAPKNILAPIIKRLPNASLNKEKNHLGTAEKTMEKYFFAELKHDLCYNHSIAQYVSYQFQKEQVYADAVTLHSFMMRFCEIEWAPELSAAFYEQELPSIFKAKSEIPAYDLVIIDEGQDVLTGVYFECIDRLVQDGFQNGNWAIYYDQNQNIFNSYTELNKMLSTLRSQAHATSWRLPTNCRNTKQIANANILMTNIPNQGNPKVSGPNVEYESYNGKTDELTKINSIIRKIKDSGAVGSDFIVLSRYTLANPQNGLGTNGLDEDLGTLKTTGPLWKAKKNDVRFSTISAFKGLESKIVILIDVDRFSDENTRLLNYVAASRACAMLYVLYDCEAEQERQNMILSGFTQVGT